MAIPDEILHKPSSLDEAEWEVVKRHPIQAQKMLKDIEFLKLALLIPLFHHERWDGGGYPEGLASDQIPLPARIFAVIDNWDALS
jgi:HD-GYP domain-containing protein (c-di-GMP phosphodiesterase class II)